MHSSFWEIWNRSSCQSNPLFIPRPCMHSASQSTQSPLGIFTKMLLGECTGYTVPETMFLRPHFETKAWSNSEIAFSGSYFSSFSPAAFLSSSIVRRIFAISLLIASSSLFSRACCSFSSRISCWRASASACLRAVRSLLFFSNSFCLASLFSFT